MSRTIGIIGTGSLGEQLAKMLIKRPDNGLSELSVIGSVRRQSRKQEILDQLGSKIILFEDNKQVAVKSDLIILSVKPSQMRDVCKEISPTLLNTVPIISVAAAVPLDKLHEWLPVTNTIIRCMPNVACSVGAGLSVYYSKSAYADALMHNIFAPNLVLPVSTDEQVDVSTLIAGSGPAFFAWYSECLKRIGEGKISKEILARMIAQTMKGTAEMLGVNSAEEIIRSVASPKGATEAALFSLNYNKIDKEINVALLTAQRRIESIVSTLE